MNHPSYLDVRCAYAIEKLNVQISERFSALISNSDASSESESPPFDESDPHLHLADQIAEAELLGWIDAQAGCTDQVPFLFAD